MLSLRPCPVTFTVRVYNNDTRCARVSRATSRRRINKSAPPNYAATRDPPQRAPRASSRMHFAAIHAKPPFDSRQSGPESSLMRLRETLRDREDFHRFSPRTCQYHRF